jgi:hypothetical protein
MASTSAPAGWPAEVRPPDAPDWERSAVGWLLDLCPAEYRGYEIVRRNPDVLGRMAQWQVEGSLEATRRGLAAARVAFERLDPPTLAATVETLEREQARLQRIAREAGLVAEALEGRRWRAKL